MKSSRYIHCALFRPSAPPPHTYSHLPQAYIDTILRHCTPNFLRFKSYFPWNLISFYPQQPPPSLWTVVFCIILIYTPALESYMHSRPKICTCVLVDPAPPSWSVTGSWTPEKELFFHVLIVLYEPFYPSQSRHQERITFFHFLQQPG